MACAFHRWSQDRRPVSVHRHAVIGPDNALAASRFVLDGAVVFLWGVSGFLLTSSSRELRLWLEERWSGALRLALALAVIATACQLPLQTAIIGAGWGDLSNVSLAWSVMTQTTSGLAWAGKAGILSMALLALMVIPAHRLVVLALASMAMLASLALSGHAAMHGGWLGGIHRANQWLHLLSGGFWIGALFPVVSTLRALHAETFRQAARAALIRFSRMGHLAVALVVVTGALNTGLILGTPPLDWSHPYQGLLAIKIGLVLSMVSIALFNRYWLVPKLSGQGGTTRALEWMTRLEVMLAALVLGLVVTLSALDPY
ncbi:copper homeostasis membrane protein CopD [Cobetia sp. 3AK]|uniref:copper homeostasis membrane protein CopD n=1 Tax=Cobetia sp. 3AK TaxID=3040020 RepID=UPI0024489717|nr:copper homeostasis membrane protein CopD [Cobetia sp. 3AK]MDH2374706.1 copper homeostasis membrane protein CopD [Cobetia sp. 3AK]